MDKKEYIAELIHAAYQSGYKKGLSVGQNDGYSNGLDDGDEEGYERGYDVGYADGKAAYNTEEDEEDLPEEPEACTCFSCTDPTAYDMGWNDGFTGEDNLDEDMVKIPAYMAGYESGKKDRKHGV